MITMTQNNFDGNFNPEYLDIDPIEDTIVLEDENGNEEPFIIMADYYDPDKDYGYLVMVSEEDFEAFEAQDGDEVQNELQIWRYRNVDGEPALESISEEEEPFIVRLMEEVDKASYEALMGEYDEEEDTK